jgi:RNA polymerase sigma factor (sigma-70 family)
VYRHHAPDPSAEAERHEEVEVVHRALGSLKPLERQVIEQRAQKVPRDKIASQLHLSLKKVFALENRARSKLRHRLRGLAPGQ